MCDTATAKKTLEALTQAPFLTAFVASRQWGTLGALSEAVRHPEAPLLQKYVDKVIPVHTGPASTQQALERAIAKGPHMTAFTPEMTTFIHGEMWQRV